MKQFILLKGLHYVKVINASSALSLREAQYAPERYRSVT